MSTHKLPLVAIVGPTASGKTALSIKLALKFDGEIISADSRQVYRGMDIGTGKATKAEQQQVPHHLLNVSSPKKEYNVAHFKRDTTKVIKQIHNQGKLPILVGGTGFWIQTIIDDLDLPTVKPNSALRKRLQKKTAAQLYTQLQRLDLRRANSIERHNPYRLIRAIEIIKATGKPVPRLKTGSPYDLLMLGITHPKPKLHRRIHTRLYARFRQGMIAEVRRLHQQGVSWKRMYAIGLEYRFISLHLQNKLSRDEMEEQLKRAIQQYAKRQMTWFKRDKRIHWVHNYSDAHKHLKKIIDSYL